MTAARTNQLQSFTDTTVASNRIITTLTPTYSNHHVILWSVCFSDVTGTPNATDSFDIEDGGVTVFYDEGLDFTDGAASFISSAFFPYISQTKGGSLQIRANCTAMTAGSLTITYQIVE